MKKYDLAFRLGTMAAVGPAKEGGIRQVSMASQTIKAAPAHRKIVQSQGSVIKMLARPAAARMPLRANPIVVPITAANPVFRPSVDPNNASHAIFGPGVSSIKRTANAKPIRSNGQHF